MFSGSKELARKGWLVKLRRGVIGARKTEALAQSEFCVMVQKEQSFSSLNIECWGSQDSSLIIRLPPGDRIIKIYSGSEACKYLSWLLAHPNHTHDPQGRIIIMVPIFQMRKLRLRDMTKVTQLKTLGSTVQTQDLSPQISVFLLCSQRGELALIVYAEARQERHHQPTLGLHTLLWSEHPPT